MSQRRLAGQQGQGAQATYRSTTAGQAVRSVPLMAALQGALNSRAAESNMQRSCQGAANLRLRQL